MGLETVWLLVILLLVFLCLEISVTIGKSKIDVKPQNKGKT